MGKTPTGNELGDRDVVALAAVLEVMPRLTLLDVSGTHLRKRSWMEKVASGSSVDEYRQVGGNLVAGRQCHRE